MRHGRVVLPYTKMVHHHNSTSFPLPWPTRHLLFFVKPFCREIFIIQFHLHLSSKLYLNVVRSVNEPWRRSLACILNKCPCYPLSRDSLLLKSITGTVLFSVFAIRYAMLFEGKYFRFAVMFLLHMKSVLLRL